MMQTAEQVHTNGLTPDKINSDILGARKRIAKSEFANEVTGDVLMNKHTESVPTLWNPIMPQVGLSCMGGSSDTGKSQWARHFAIAVACGHNSFCGYGLNVTHRSAIYLSTEDSEHNTSYLLRKQAHQHESNDLKGLRFLFDPDNPLKTLRNSLKNRLADLVVVDTFGDVFTGTLNDSQHVRAFLNPYQQLSVEFGCQILFLHHTGKRTEDFAPSKSNLLGSQGFEAKMRLVMELRRDQSNPNQRHLCVVKGNYLPSQMKNESFVLEFSDEHFTFKNTDERTPFELLAKPQEDATKKKYELYVALTAEGKSGDELARLLGYSHRASVTKLKKTANDRGWTTEVA